MLASAPTTRRPARYHPVVAPSRPLGAGPPIEDDTTRATVPGVAVARVYLQVVPLGMPSVYRTRATFTAMLALRLGRRLLHLRGGRLALRLPRPRRTLADRSLRLLLRRGAGQNLDVTTFHAVPENLLRHPRTGDADGHHTAAASPDPVLSHPALRLVTTRVAGDLNRSKALRTENLATVKVQTLDHVGKPLLHASGLNLVDLLRERGCHRVTRNNHVTGGGGVTRRDVVALENVEPERTANLTVPQPLRGTGGVHADEQIRVQELPVERGRD